VTTETRFHHHWFITVPSDSRIVRWLQKPLRKVDFETAKKSRFVWGAETMDSKEWVLTPLGILHTLTGLTLILETPPERCEKCGMRHLADLRHDWTDGT